MSLYISGPVYCSKCGDVLANVGFPLQGKVLARHLSGIHPCENSGKVFEVKLPVVEAHESAFFKEETKVRR